MPRPLDGAWSLASTEPGAAASPQDLDSLDLRWIPCRGPMTAAAALRAAGEWTLDQPRDFDASDWWYRCRFACDPRGGERLRFEGLATIADVWLNGRHILHADNMFVAHTVEVDLRASNELLLRFSAFAASPLRRDKPAWRTRLVSSNALRWHRSTLLGRMPGWCPSVAPVGPWRPIVLESGPRQARSTAWKPCGHDAPDNLWTVSVSLRTFGSASSATLRVGDREATLVRDGDEWTGSVDIDQPNLWWPHTHGSQPLYDVHARVDGETIDVGRIGFRTIEVDRGEDGKGFGLIVNGEPFFCRGVCWTPLDIARLHVEPHEYRAALEQLRDAGVNMIRIAGPMAYETPAFYDLCDALGILVWQDLMFASMDYPWEDEAFARSVETEVSQVLASLRSRPSLAVVCGNSEIDMQAAMLGKSAARRSNRLESDVLPALVRTLTPDAVWVPGTPDGGAHCCRVNAGVSHYYGAGAYRRPFEDARRAGVRFAAECLAFSNVPESATIDDPPKAGVPRDRGADWDFEDVRDHYVERIFGVDAAPLRAHDPERWLALGRVATGEAMLRTFSEWRRPGSSCRGALVWLARDLQPGAGWGVIDASGQPKAAYWYLKRAFAPIALLCTDEGLNGLWLHAINDSASAVDAEVRVAIYRGGTRYATASTAMTIPPRGSQSVCADALFDEFVDLTGAYRFGARDAQVVAASMVDRVTGARIASTVYCAGPTPWEEDDDLELAAVIETHGDEHVLVLRASRFAHAVRIEAPGWMPDDNYFHLEPDEDRRVALRPAASAADLRVRVSALNASRSVTVAAEAIHAG